jgi:hypothetical protein
MKPIAGLASGRSEVVRSDRPIQRRMVGIYKDSHPTFSRPQRSLPPAPPAHHTVDPTQSPIAVAAVFGPPPAPLELLVALVDPHASMAQTSTRGHPEISDRPGRGAEHQQLHRGSAAEHPSVCRVMARAEALHGTV